MGDNIPEWLIRENTNLREEIERLLEEIQQLKHDSTIFINERSDAICENFDLREENAELRDEIERLRAALQEIFDHECRTSGRSFIACTARDALWPHAALEGEKTDV